MYLKNITLEESREEILTVAKEKLGLEVVEDEEEAGEAKLA